MGFFNKVRSFLQRHLYGCNGIDSLGKFNFALIIVFAVLTWISNIIPSAVFIISVRVIYLLLFVLFFFRVLSKNIVKRSRENVTYIKVVNSLKEWFKLQKTRINDRKTHVYRKCPKCRAVLRLKRVKGEHRTTCPRCANSFKLRV